MVAESTPPGAAKNALGMLQLPVFPQDFDETLNVFWSAYASQFENAEAVTVLEALEMDVANWLEMLSSEPRLSSAIEACLINGAKKPLTRRKEPFCAFVSSLAEKYSLKPFEAIRIASNLHLVFEMTSAFRMASSAVSAYIIQRIGVAKLNSVIVGELRSYLTEVVELDGSKIQSQLQVDEAEAERLFSDASLADIVETLNQNAFSLGATVPIGDRFSELIRHPPYIQMLHYQTLLVEFYDAVASNLYEFSPRGVVASSLFEHHRAKGLETGADNPFLNNAKSAHTADLNWAIQKKATQRPAALALSEILQELDSLPYPARKSLSGIIRSAVLQFIEIESATTKPVVRPVEQSAQLESWLESVSSNNTQTRGVLEQRTVDWALSSIYRGDKWILLGLGDSVNATNISRKKLGDVECINSADRRIEAYEPHGGHLTAKYVEEHLRTTKKVLSLRYDSLRLIAPPEAWKITLQFVAHSHETVQHQLVHLGFNVQVGALTFKELFSRQGDRGLTDFNSIVVERLNLPGVRGDIRAEASKLLTI